MGKLGRRWLGCLLLGFLCLHPPTAAWGATLVRLQLEDTLITPVTADYLQQGLEKAEQINADAVLLVLDTPGGLLSSTHTMVKAILNAPIPVIVYVGPVGARAASAGMFITVAAHVAAMAPATRIGAAHPVAEGSEWSKPTPTDDDRAPAQPAEEDTPPTTQSNNAVLSDKILNDTLSTVEGLARLRGRNAQWLRDAVTHSVSITEQQAVELDVVDQVARTESDLLRQLNGQTVVVKGQPVTLDFSTLQIETVPFSVQREILSTLANPMVSYLLLMLGFYALLFEVTHPGAIVPGIAGFLLLVLGLVGIQALSISLAGVGLLALGMGLFAVELFTPSFGLWFAGGFVSVLLGAMMLFNQSQEPYLQQFLWPVAGTTIALAALTGFALYSLGKVYRRKPVTEQDRYLGQRARCTTDVVAGEEGKVMVLGEIWPARLAEGVRVERLPHNSYVTVTGYASQQPRVLVVQPETEST